ncbi:DNA (cytosine-5-)-methyltransferase [Vibrio kasasachensis]|uniref:DNA (cytosine-5-)-methyltransferase n=1 Tax=Vibrio kasasachensis TaxID=2910248 RepID=UPI003D0D7ECA
MTVVIESTSEYIKNTRKNLGLELTEFANLLGMSSTGERTVRGWERGDHQPTKAKLEAIENLKAELDERLEKAPFRKKDRKDCEFTFIDLFAGIGGIRLPFQELGGYCEFTSEWDKFAQKTYLHNYGEMPHGDITKISADDIPPHDVLLGGFPCQAFSQAGLRQGFSDTRGTMFFEIQRILAEKRPKAFLLENVKQLQGHNKGETLKTILSILRGEFEQEIPEDVPMSEEARHALSQKLNYCVDVKVLRAGDFGIPQNRERVFIVGFDRDHFGMESSLKLEDIFTWPVGSKDETKVKSILLKPEDFAKLEDKYTISDKLWAGHKKRKEDHKTKGNGFGYSLFKPEDSYTNTISARYYKDGSEILIDQGEGKNPRKLTPRECANLQGFPKDFIVDAVSHGQIYKQFGNSVCMTVIEALAHEVVRTMTKNTES